MVTNAESRLFAAPVLIWSWPILFIGFAIQFFAWIPLGAVFVGILCGTLFLIMGLAPLIFELRAGPRRLVLGRSNANDVPFTENARRMARRDGSHPDPDHPSMRRYVEGQRIYLAACRPRERATVVIDNRHPQ